MALTDHDLMAIAKLMSEAVGPIQNEVTGLRREMIARFETIQGQVLELYNFDKKRQEEYIFIKAQLERIERKIDRRDQYFDDMDARVTVLEHKTA